MKRIKNQEGDVYIAEDERSNLEVSLRHHQLSAGTGKTETATATSTTSSGEKRVTPHGRSECLIDSYCLWPSPECL